MNPVINTLTPGNPGRLLQQLKWTRLRNAMVQHWVLEKFKALMSGSSQPVFPAKISINDEAIESPPTIFPVQHIVTRPLSGFTTEFVQETIQYSMGLLAYKGSMTHDELETIQKAWYRISVASPSWRDSSYIFITKK